MSDRHTRLIANSIEYLGKHYATLDCTPPSQSEIGTQSEFVALPSGWILAPDVPGIQENVIAKHPWGTHVLVLESGRSYYSGSGMGTGYFGDNCLTSADVGNTYKPNTSELRVLIQWDGPCPSVHRAQLSMQLWKEKQFCDCKVTCGGDSIMCHRAVLASVSPVFQGMLSSEMVEAKQQEISVRDSTPEAVEAFIEFIYTGEVSWCHELTLPILLLADFYQIDSLATICSLMVVQSVDPDNVVAVIRQLKKLRERPNMNEKWNELLAKVQGDPALFAQIVESL